MIILWPSISRIKKIIINFIFSKFLSRVIFLNKHKTWEITVLVIMMKKIELSRVKNKQNPRDQKKKKNQERAEEKQWSLTFPKKIPLEIFFLVSSLVMSKFRTIQSIFLKQQFDLLFSYQDVFYGKEGNKTKNS